MASGFAKRTASTKMSVFVYKICPLNLFSKTVQTSVKKLTTIPLAGKLKQTNKQKKR